MPSDKVKRAARRARRAAEAAAPANVCSKWTEIEISTQPLIRSNAIAAAADFCAAIRLGNPKIQFCASPRGAYLKMQSQRLTAYEQELYRNYLGWLSLYLQLYDYPEEEALLLTTITGRLNRLVKKQLQAERIKNRACCDLLPEDLVVVRFGYDVYLASYGKPFGQKNMSEALRLTENLSNWVFYYDDTCIVCERPVKLLLDSEQRPHAEGEPAIQFGDGFHVYAHHGVWIPEEC